VEKLKKIDIKIIAFDLGGVLVADDTTLLEQRYNYNSLPRHQQVKYRNAVEKAIMGKLPTAQLLKIIQATITPNLSLIELRNQMLDLPVFWANYRLAQKLKKQYRIVILTNSEYNWPQAIAKRTKTNLTQFIIINSARIGLKKPHSNYFHYVFKRLKVTPQQMVFIDDRLSNVKAAQKLGIHAFQYKNNHAKLLKFLRQLKIKGL
jgi:HAD superfamily hydrolase (TIGR01549 family)